MQQQRLTLQPSPTQILVTGNQQNAVPSGDAEEAQKTDDRCNAHHTGRHSHCRYAPHQTQRQVHQHNGRQRRPFELPLQQQENHHNGTQTGQQQQARRALGTFKLPTEVHPVSIRQRNLCIQSLADVLHHTPQIPPFDIHRDHRLAFHLFPRNLKRRRRTRDLRHLRQGHLSPVGQRHRALADGLQAAAVSRGKAHDDV